MPDAVTCRAPAEMARHPMALSRRYGVVGLKRTRCAAAMGNKVFPSPALMAATEEALTGDVVAFLRRTQWPAGEPVVVVAWVDATCSPSTQLWIEPGSPPRLDGIYEQVLEGPEQVFVGSRPSTLPAQVNRVLADAAVRVATALQHLGYVGRCSFDHLVLGDPETDFTVQFTECNGRWGGTSAPMHLVDRVVLGPRPPYRAQEVSRRSSSECPSRTWPPPLATASSTTGPVLAGICSTTSGRCSSLASWPSSPWPAHRRKPTRRCNMICRSALD